MKKLYKHLSFNDRLKVERGLNTGKSVRKIADMLRVHTTTIYRERKRGTYTKLNSDYTTSEKYSPDIAETRYRENLAAKGRQIKLGHDHELAQFIEKKIADEGFSPEAVVAYIKNNGLVFNTKICAKTIYNYIDKGIFLRLTNKDLPRHGNVKRKYGRVKKTARAAAGDSIELRPPEVLLRERFGDWEMDTVVGCAGCKSVLLVLSERKTRMELAFKMPDKTAASTVQVMNSLEKHFGNMFRLTFRTNTVDNGPEFSDRDGLEKSIFQGEPRTHMYYCHPYSAFERGTNENINGMIRRFFPKGTNFDRVTQDEINRAISWINNYPRKILNWRTAMSFFMEELANLEADA